MQTASAMFFRFPFLGIVLRVFAGSMLTYTIRGKPSFPINVIRRLREFDFQVDEKPHGSHSYLDACGPDSFLPVLAGKMEDEDVSDTELCGAAQ